MNSNSNSILLIIIIVLNSCTDNLSQNIPVELQNLENLVTDLNVKAKVSLTFTKEQIYKDSDEYSIGMVQEVTVDSIGRVFIADNNQKAIHVFDSDGRYLKYLGRDGSGPGEFSFIKRLHIRGSKLYAFDHSLFRVITIDLYDLSDVQTLSLGQNRSHFSGLSKSFPSIDDLFVRSDNKFIAKYINHEDPISIKWQNFVLFGQFYLLDDSGNITGWLMNFKDATRTMFAHPNAIMGIPIKPFFGNTITAITNDDHIYMIQPEHFLLKVFNPQGHYEKSFYYELDRIKLTEESARNANVIEMYTSNMHNMNLPEFWPVVTDMLIDDQDQLWVATTVEDFSVYEWWVVKTTGELVARFDWPRNKPIEYIANGNIFTKETDEDSGMQQVVRYRIVSE